MAAVEVRGLIKRFGNSDTGTVAIDDVTFDIQEGEFLVLLGPSGCGKTTTLRCLAGLDRGDSGQISMRKDIVFDATRRLNRPPEKRNIGMVFQSYALWPNMTVRQNLEYPLKARRLQVGLDENWAQEIARVVECEHLLERYPGQLSGGQQQRVALARGLVSRPDLMLFDEPLSNLDARLRKSVRSELHLLHRRLRFTAVYVTHDQEEAFALADRLMIMRDGRVEQSGTPFEVYRNPANDYVAEFIGMSNRLLVESTGSTWSIAGQQVQLDSRLGRPTSGSELITLRLRPEDIDVSTSRTGPSHSDTVVEGVFVDASFLSRAMEVVVQIGSELIIAQVPSAHGYEAFGSLEPGTPLWLSFQLSEAAAFDQRGNPIGATNAPNDAGQDLIQNRHASESTPR